MVMYTGGLIDVAVSDEFTTAQFTIPARAGTLGKFCNKLQPKDEVLCRRCVSSTRGSSEEMSLNNNRYKKERQKTPEGDQI